MTDQTSADDVARERATQYVQKACQWLPPMTGEQQDRLLNEIAAIIQAERARVIEACAKVCEAKANKHGRNYNLPSVGRELAHDIRAMLAEAERTASAGKGE